MFEDVLLVLENKLFGLILLWLLVKMRLSIFVEMNLLALLLILRYLNFDEITFLVATFSLV